MNDTWKEKYLSDDKLNQDSGVCKSDKEELATFLLEFTESGFEEFIEDNFDIICTDDES